jgi:hypothetical protein
MLPAIFVDTALHAAGGIFANARDFLAFEWAIWCDSPAP